MSTILNRLLAALSEPLPALFFHVRRLGDRRPQLDSLPRCQRASCQRLFIPTHTIDATTHQVLCETCRQLPDCPNCRSKFTPASDGLRADMCAACAAAADDWQSPTRAQSSVNPVNSVNHNSIRITFA